MYSIGELSRISQLTIKSLRFYHEKGLLIPDKIDRDSKYRYYRKEAVQRAMTIKQLKSMGFSIKEIQSIMFDYTDDEEMRGFVESKLKETTGLMKLYTEQQKSLNQFLDYLKEDQIEHPTEILKETVPEMLIASIRFKGQYHESGEKFGILARKCGRFLKGKPFSLYFDDEYKEDGADIEACFEVRKEVKADVISCRILSGGNADVIYHHGPYSELTRSYQKLYHHTKEQKREITIPIMEKYIKGPGFIFQGNPKKYITKIFFFSK